MEFKIEKIVRDMINIGHTERWIAARTNVSQVTVHRIKHGQTKNPRMDTYFKIMDLHKQCF